MIAYKESESVSISVFRFCPSQSIYPWPVSKVAPAVMFFITSLLALLSIARAAVVGERQATRTDGGVVLASTTVPDYFQISPAIFQGKSIFSNRN